MVRAQAGHDDRPRRAAGDGRGAARAVQGADPGARGRRAAAPQRGRQGAQARAADRRRRAEWQLTDGGAASGRRRTRTGGPRSGASAAGAAACTLGLDLVHHLGADAVGDREVRSDLVEHARRRAAPRATRPRWPRSAAGTARPARGRGRSSRGSGRCGGARGRSARSSRRALAGGRAPRRRAGLREEGVQQRDVGRHALRRRAGRGASASARRSARRPARAPPRPESPSLAMAPS